METRPPAATYVDVQYNRSSLGNEPPAGRPFHPKPIMADTTVAAGAAPAPQNVFARFFGVLFEPRKTFESIVAYPKVLGMLCLTIVLSAFAAAVPLTTDGGKQAAVEQQVAAMESFGMQVDDQAYAQIQGRAWMLPYTTAGGVVVFAPVMVLVMSGILFAVFNAAMGGSGTFKQVMAVVVHAGVISTVGGLFSGVLNYFREAAGSATNLAVLMPFVEEKSFVGRLAGTIDLFLIWWLLVLAIGLAVLYRRRTQPIAITLFSIYAIIALVIAVVRS